MPLEFDGVNGIIKNTTSDGDVTIKGNDGGSEISLLTFDVSAEGAATFNSTIAMTSFAVTDGSTITTADNTTQLTLISTDADANAGPKLALYRNSSSPADNDLLGQIRFLGEDDAGAEVAYSEISAVALDVSDGTTDTELRFDIRHAGSVNRILTLTPTEVSINNGSFDSDFRVESNGNQHMLFVDANNDHVNIGTSTAYAGKLNIETDDNSFNLFLVSTDADANAGPNMKFYRNSGSPADNDITGNIYFTGRNDNSQDVDYAHIETLISDASDGAEDGYMNIYVAHAGTKARSRIEMDSTEMVINEGGVDLDFRVESDGNANMLFVDGGNNQVQIGGTAATFGELGITGSSNGDANIDMYASVGSGSEGKAEIFFSTDSSSDHVSCASIVMQQDGASARKGEILFKVADNGGPATAVTIQNNKNVVFGAGLIIGGTGAANTLDDYEEGTYAPVFTVASGSLTPHGSHNALAYTKIGRVVHVQGEVRFSSVSSPSGNFSVSLPFAVADLTDGAARSTSGAIGQSGFGGTPDATYYFRITSEGTATAFFATHNSGSDTGVNANQVSTSTEMILSFTFIAA